MAYVGWTASFEDTPAGTDPVSSIDDKFSEFKEQTRRLLLAAGVNLPDISVTEDGTTPHTPGTKAGIPGVLMVDAGGSGLGGQIWMSDGSAKVMDPTDAGVNFPTATPATGGNITTLNNPGHGHDVTLAVVLEPITTGRVPGVIFENRGNGDITLLHARLIAWTAPSGGSVVVQMVLLDSAYTNPATDAGTDVFTSGNRPSVSDGNNRGAVWATIDDATLEEGEAWVFEADSISGAGLLTLLLKVRRV